jgi:DNA-binding NarL/FixJ family response regulator
VRIVIADDSMLLREGLARLMDELGHEVVAAVGDAPSLRPAVAEHDPDLAIVDVRMPPTFTDDGLRASVELREVHPRTAVLVLSQFVEISYADELFASGQGSVGYLLKDRVQDLDVLERAIDTVVGGGSVLDPEVVSRLLSVRRENDPVTHLTPRERDVIALMAEGRSNKAIATELVVSEGAVQKHIGNIFTKLDLLPSDGDHRRVLAVLAWLQQR